MRLGACCIALASIASHATAGATAGASDSPPAALVPRVTPDGSPSQDGVYGRFDGDLDWAIALGVEVADSQASGQLWSSLHYYSTVGVYVSYADAFDSGAPYARALSLDFEVRPLFIPRWSYDAERGPGFLDLTLDSAGIGLGAFWDQPLGADFGARHGLEAFVGFGIPLFAHARGPWLQVRGLRRFTDGSEPGAYNVLVVNLAWHQLFESGMSRR